MIAPFLFVAAAAALVPTRRAAGFVRAPSTRPRDAPPRLLVPATVVAVGAAAVAAAGPARGLSMAAVLCPLAWLVLTRLLRVRRTSGPAANDPAVPLVLDLTAAALRAGRPLAGALAAAARAAPDGLGADLARIAGLLRLGAGPAVAWHGLEAGPLAPVAVVAVRSATSGVRLASGFERLAGELRAAAVSDGAARAQRAGVYAMAPLGLCFLPSFVLLGVVPVVVGIARTALGGLG